MTNDNKIQLLNVLIKQGFSFSFLKKSDEEIHKEFISRHWPKSPIKGDFTYNTWKFSKKSDQEINVIICKFNNKIVGQLGVIPLKIVVKNKEYDCGWGCNFIIDEVYKNVGLGAAIDIFAMNYYPIFLGTNGTKESEKYKQKLGWQRFEGPETFYFPIKINDFLKIKKWSANTIKIIDFASLLLNPLWSALNYAILLSYNEKRWENTDQKNILERISNRKIKSDIPYILHNKNFFDWRRSTPGEEREIKFMISKNSYSYVVYFISSARINILEHYFETKSDFGSFLKAIMLKEKNSNIGLLKIFANYENEIKLFKSYFFKPLQTKNNFMIFSEYNLFEGIRKIHADMYDGDGMLS